MKKFFLTAILVTGLIACDKKADTNSINVNDTTTSGNVELEAPSNSSETPTNTSSPKFSSPEVQKVADEYASFVNEYVSAYKAGDTSKIQELVSKQQEWSTKLQSAMSNMTPNDVKAWTDYMQKLSEEMTAAAMANKK